LYDVKRHQHALNALLFENKTPSLRALIKAVNARGIAVPKGFSQSLLNVNTPFEYALIS
jgi:molybdopterin-guanine dinucleotide biosynthesis protein A